MNKDLNRYFSHPVVVAAELFSAGWCNLACKYCYIPKTDFLKGIHKSIIESIEDGTYIKDLKEMYGDKLESLAHWGTEPTLTVKKFKKFYEEAEKAFPKLKEIKISSNFMTNPDNLLQWVTEVIPQNKKLDISIQVSLDGPPFITDKNRIGGSTKQIMKNCLEFTKALNKVGTHHKVTMHVKPTFGEDDIETMSEFSKALTYYEFFDDFMTLWFETNKNKTVEIYKGCDPTIVLPGTYITEDGINFYNLLLNQIELQKRSWKTIATPESNYYWRWRGKLFYYKEYFTKQKMFTCSAGDSCFGLGDIPGTVHLCHQSFYMDHPEYVGEAKKYGLDPQTMDGIESGRVDDLTKNYIKQADDDFNMLKMIYKNRAYNDFTKHKISVSVALALELAHCGQINECYKDEKMAEMISLFVQTTDCPLDNIAIAGSQLVSSASLLRLFGNGVFENIFGRLLKNMGYI